MYSKYMLLMSYSIYLAQIAVARLPIPFVFLLNRPNIHNPSGDREEKRKMDKLAFDKININPNDTDNPRQPSTKHRIILGIDFGTTYSGVAWV